MNPAADRGGGVTPTASSPQGLCPHCGYDLLRDEPIERDGLEIDPRTHRLVWQGRSAHLSPASFMVLHALVKADGAVLSPAVLMDRIGSDGDQISNGTAVRISEIRRRLPGVPIITVHAVGFAWRPA